MKEGWEYKKLGEVCNTSSGGTPSKSHMEYYEGGTIPWLRSGEVAQGLIYSTELCITDLGMKNSSAKLFPIDTVVIAMYGATVGQVGILKKEMTTNQAICGVFPNKIFYPMFLFYCLKAKKSFFIKDAIGGAQPNISQNLIKKTEVPVPPLAEQHHIVEELDLLSSIIEKKKAQLKELDNLAQSLFYEMFGDPITNDKGWEVMTLEAISHLITDGSHYSPKDDAKGVIPMLSVKDMRQTHFSYGTCKWIGKVEYNKLVANGCKPLKDDVLIAKDGSFFKYIFVLTQEREQAILSSIAILRPKVSLVNPHYVARYLSTKEIFSKVEREYLTGTAIKRVILKGIRKMPIILPPLSLQQQFASKIEAIEHQKELIKQSIKEVETLFNSRMDYYFN